MPLTIQHSRRTLLYQGLMLGSGALLALSMLAASTHAGSSDQVQVCHFPPGNLGNFKVLNIPQSAVEEHLGHGDTLVEEDANCDGMPDVRCPCDFSAAKAEAIGLTGAAQCSEILTTNVRVYLIGEDGANAMEIWQLTDGRTFCGERDEGQFESHGIATESEHAACVTAIQEVAEGLGVTCPAPPDFQF